MVLLRATAILLQSICCSTATLLWSYCGPGIVISLLLLLLLLLELLLEQTSDVPNGRPAKKEKRVTQGFMEILSCACITHLVWCHFVCTKREEGTILSFGPELGEGVMATGDYLARIVRSDGGREGLFVPLSLAHARMAFTSSGMHR